MLRMVHLFLIVIHTLIIFTIQATTTVSFKLLYEYEGAGVWPIQVLECNKFVCVGTFKSLLLRGVLRERGRETSLLALELRTFVRLLDVGMTSSCNVGKWSARTPCCPVYIHSIDLIFKYIRIHQKIRESMYTEGHLSRRVHGI